MTGVYKLEAIKLVEERGVTIAQVRRDLDVPVNVLRKWLRKFRQAQKEKH